MIEKLWKEYENTKEPEAREKLIMACMPYVKFSAYRLSSYANPSQEVDDLINAGIIGVVNALEAYDASKGSGFKNYAKYRIHGSIMDEIRSMNWVPYSTREKAKSIQKAMRELENEGKDSHDESLLAEALEVSLEKYYDMLMEVNRMTLFLLEDAFYDGEIPSSENSYPKGPEEETVQAEKEALLSNAIDTLPKKERLVITLYYYEEMTMKEIGKALDISESRVCQIHSSAIIRLHSKLKFSEKETKYNESIA
ncbi:FliA/WhiG family RNA polymerase sigma factor [Candidatus Poribacteria bacterium]|nr:FliA/WhiG family RNA polymerase sigma factor [Candidatus Poribacteria bacterium]